jgi:hypothetical protein
VSKAQARFTLTLAIGLCLTLGAMGVVRFSGSLPAIVIVKPPFETDAPRALVVMDEGARKDMTSNQIAAFEGADVIDWTSENLKQFIVLDKDAKSELAAKWQKEAWASYEEKSNGKLPWLVIANAKTGESSAYADNPEDAIKQLSKYGGKQ